MLRNLPMDHRSVLWRMKDWGVKCRTFFDVGAAGGEFGEVIREVWPQSKICFFEAAPHWKAALEATAARLAGSVLLNMVAVGEETGQRCESGAPYLVSKKSPWHLRLDNAGKT